MLSCYHVITMMTWSLSHICSASYQLLPTGWNRTTPTTHTHTHSLKAPAWYTELKEKPARLEARSDFTNPFLSQSLVSTCLVQQTPGNRILHWSGGRQGSGSQWGESHTTDWKPGREMIYQFHCTKNVEVLDAPTSMSQHLSWKDVSFSGDIWYTNGISLHVHF